MEGHERELKLSLIRLLVGLLVLCVLILIGFCAFGRGERASAGEKGAESPELKMRNDERYQLKIDYQKTEIPELDTKAEEYTLNLENEFYKKSQEVETLVDDQTFDLIVNSKQVDYKDVLFVQITSFEYTGGAHYEQEDKNFVYDKAENRFLTILDFLEGEDSLQALSMLAQQAIIQFFEERGNNTYLKDSISDGTEPVAENYQFFSLSESGLKLVFPPYTVGSRSDGQVEILIPYSNLRGILKEKFLGEELAQADLPQQSARDLSKYAGKKLLAFTFDDGPNNATTISLVDGLQKYDARVTFFVLGNRVQAHSEALKYAYEKGNQIGSHTYNHLDLDKLSESQLRSEIEDTDTEIEKVLGIKPKVLRPPYGANCDYVNEMVMRPIIQWDVDTLDWKNRDSDIVAKEILDHASDGGIVLLHDIYQTSVDGCLKAMKRLYQEGYAFVTIDELAQLKSVNLGDGKVYYHLG